MVLEVSTSDAEHFFIAPGSARHCEYFADWSNNTLLELPQQPFLQGPVVATVLTYLDHYSSAQNLPPIKVPQPLSCRADLDDLLTEWEKEEFLLTLTPVRHLANVAKCADYLGIPRLVAVTAAVLAWYFHSNPSSLRTSRSFLET